MKLSSRVANDGDRADPPIAVLHVDDDPAIGDLVKTFLERETSTFEVVTKTAASEGIEHLRRNSVDCVVSDYDMPSIDGLEFLETVRDTHPDIPFILFTGKGSEEIASKAISKGVTDYLQKGSGTSQYEVLANRIQNNVDRYRTKQELEQSRQLLDRFLELSPTAVLILDRKGNIIRVNEHAEDLLGIPREQLLTGTCNDKDWQVVDADGNEIPDDALPFQRVLETGKAIYDVEQGIKQPDGKTIWHSVNAAPLWDTVDSSGYVIAVLFEESP